MFNAEVLVSLYGMRRKNAELWVPHFYAAFRLAEITTPQRMACFLAQVGHESGCLVYKTELWGPTTQQLRYEPVTRLSKDLGNSSSGDGKRYMGRGLIQVTGRANYAAMTKAFNNEVDFVEHPEALATPKYAALSAAMFWKLKNLNKFCDAYDFAGLTKKINGGYNGLAHRQALYTKAIALC